MQDLFRKYLDNQCSPAEVKELLAYFDGPENEDALRILVAESLEIAQGEEVNQWDKETSETFARIKKQLHAEKGRLVPLVRRRWFQVAAAAVLLVGGFAVYNWMNNPNQQRFIQQAGSSKQLIGPGSNKAVLTLADGSFIDLAIAVNGSLTKQGNTNVLKTADGQLAYKALNEKPTEVLLNTIVTPRGGQYQVMLSDGSSVWLNAASSLRFPATFLGKERKVILTGEAYFEVAKNSAMPFKVVIDGKGEIEVLGTHFNVNAYPDEKTINTTLLRGRVKVAGLLTMDAQILVPGEQARLDSIGHINIARNADTSQAMAWKNGSFHFKNADLETVFRQLSRWYDMEVIFQGPVPPRQFNGEIHRNLQLVQLLNLLEKNKVFCRVEGRNLVVLQ